MKYGKLKEVTGDWVKSTVRLLEKEQMGCSSLWFDTDAKDNYAVCIGWHHYDDKRLPDGKYEAVWKVAWKIGRQSHRNASQCDFDIDFEMPYNPETGDVDCTCEVIDVVDGKPEGYASWAELAAYMRKTARRVWNDWKEENEDD